MIEFIIKFDSSLLDALNKLETNKKGIIFLVDKKKKLIGSLTDGDVRRHLLEDKVSNIKLIDIANLNPVFIYANLIRPTQITLDKLSMGYKAIPIVNEDNVIVEVISEQKIYDRIISKSVYSRAPMRCSLSGGGTDLQAFYIKDVGKTISLTIKKFVYCQITKHPKHEIIVETPDINQTINVPDGDYESALSKAPSNLALITLSKLKLDPGHKVKIWSDVIVGSGLASSTAMVTAIIYAFDKYKGIYRSKNEAAELSFGIERVSAGMLGGWQDQFASSFGGANLINYSRNGHQVIPLKLSDETIAFLESSLFLIYTGQNHNSPQIQSYLINKINISDNKSLNNMNNITEKFLDILINGPLSDIGKMLNQSWKLKQDTNHKISNTKLNSLYDELLSLGAIGSKLLGAGAGGYFLSFVMPDKSKEFEIAVKNIGYSIERFNFYPKGAEAWTL